MKTIRQKYTAQVLQDLEECIKSHGLTLHCTNCACITQELCDVIDDLEKSYLKLRELEVLASAISNTEQQAKCL